MKALFPKDFQSKESGTWTSPMAPSISYSEGNEAEAYLTSVLTQASDLSSTSMELEQKIIDWSSEYHLSPLRANVLRPFKFKERCKILEVGSGCGAITRYLGEQGHDVTALEGSFKRAKLTRLRCRDLPNVKVVSANLWDIDFQEKFDVITFIGVLEYAAQFGPERSINDFKSTMDWAKRLLNPNGVLVVAIENKFGLKYFSGCPEDHSGRLFDGIEGYYTQDSVRTFGKDELQSLLVSAGFKDSHFFLPFPDYKIPSVVLAGRESYVKHNQDFNLSGWCDMPFESYGVRRRYFINDQLALREFEKNGLLDEVANSHIVFATEGGSLKDSPLVFDSCWIAKKINLNRNRKFQTMTTLRFENEAIVTKEKLFDQETLTMNGTLRNHAKTEPYLCGREKLSLEMLRAARHRDLDQDQFWKLFKQYHQYLLSHADSDGNLPPDHIDLLPFNVMVNPDGSLCGFDYEWVLKEKISFKRVLFRSAITFYTRERKWLRNLRERPMTSVGFAKLVFSKLSVRLTAHDVRTFMQEEGLFQEMAGSREHHARQNLRQAFTNYLSENSRNPISVMRDAIQLVKESPQILYGRLLIKRPVRLPRAKVVVPTEKKPSRIVAHQSPWASKMRRLFLIDHYFLLENLVVRNLKVKYRRSFFGFFWTLLHPLLSSSIYYFLFKHVAKLDIPNYGAFVVVSNIPWTFFSQSVVEAAECMVNSRDLLRKIYCPREVFPMSSVLTNFITLFLSLPVIGAFAYLGGGNLSIVWLALIPVSILTLFFAHVLGLLLSVLYVFFRDVKHLMSILMQILFFATPVVYEASMVPDSMQFVLRANPMAALIPAYRDILLKNIWPNWTALAEAGVITGLAGVVAYYVFAQYNRAIPEYL